MKTTTETNTLAEFASDAAEQLAHDDPTLYDLLEQERRRQSDALALIASSCVAHPSVLACQGTVLSNTTTEGYPGARYHAGCEVVDQIERLAIERAKTAFRAQYANVQPHSGSSANEVLMFSLLKPGDIILGMDLASGGHLTHGAKASVSGRYFQAVGYGVDVNGTLDYDRVRRLALEHKPKLIICGASSYPRTIDFQKFREIADEVGAWLLADISHIAGLVVAGEHPSPIDHAHFTTTSTYKQLVGPRGGLILMGRDYQSPAPTGKRNLSDMVQHGVFPYFQGTPNLSTIAAKARALEIVASPEFKDVARRIVSTSRRLAEEFLRLDYPVVTGGTDNHIVMVDVSGRTRDGLAAKRLPLTGAVAEHMLEQCGIIVNKNMIPGDPAPPTVTSGIRLGTNILAQRGMDSDQMPACATLIEEVLSSLTKTADGEFQLPAAVKSSVRDNVAKLCRQYPLPT